MSQNNISEATRQAVLEKDRLSDEGDVRAATEEFQRDFPYERGEEAQVTRREFCNFLGLTSAALFAGAAGFAGKSVLDTRERYNYTVAQITGAENLTPNSALNFHYPTDSDSAILIRASDGTYHAYGQQCTHLACPVYYAREHQRLECPCHEGAFDASTGKVLYGPPPRPLEVIDLEVKDGQVLAIGRRASGEE